MERVSDGVINKAASGDGAALAKINKYLKEYSASLSSDQKDHLKIEANSIVLKGMDYRMSKEKMKAWGMLIDVMVREIRSAEIPFLN
jgi:hypothetical protein